MTARSGPPPPTIEELVRRATGATSEEPTLIRLHQRGEMRPKPDAQSTRWTGVEEMQVRTVGFSWRARFPLFPGVWLLVEDSYRNGAGSLEGRLWGRIPLFRSTGAEVNLAQAMRYLAELPWVPPAMIANAELRWHAIDSRQVEVTCPAAGPRAKVRLELDGQGDIVGASAPARPRTVGQRTVDTAWGGRFADYAVLGGMRVPRHGEVYWELPEGRFVYWRGEVTAVETVF